MSVIHEYEGEDWIFAKGGAGGFKKLVKWKVNNGEIVPIEDGDFENAAEANRIMASKAMRVIALCARKVQPDDDITDMESMEDNLIFLGWLESWTLLEQRSMMQYTDAKRLVLQSR